MMSGYARINKLIDGRIDLLSLGHLRLFLELNALVLCGRDEQKRLDAARHLAATDRFFFTILTAAFATPSSGMACMPTSPPGSVRLASIFAS
jgi:hypothetical protein